MALNANLLRAHIQAVLTPLGLYSPEAEELLMATCAQESLLGKYREQVGGPALGIFQMEPATFQDICTNYLAYHPALDTKILALGGSAQDMINNDELAIAMARVLYLRAPGALPAATDLAAIWAYYKAHYNTPLGAAKQIDFYRHYHELVQGPAR
jgi:hypothetical protein